MKRKLLCTLLALFILLALLPAPVRAKSFSVNRGICDLSVFAPAVYDLAVSTDAEEPTYQWMARVGNSDFLSLEDNEHYQGVHTAHLQLRTHEGMVYGDGWEDIRFACAVTDKDGTTVLGPDDPMMIFPHTGLLDRMKRDGVDFHEFGVTASGHKATLLETVDGVPYYEVPGGANVYPYFVFGTIDKRIASDNGLSLKVETTVTQNGKTSYYSSNIDGIVASRVGKAALALHYKLILQMDGQDMDVLDTETVVVNVLPPEPVGSGKTKSACAVLKEQYSQAEVLTRLPAGVYVSLLEQAGGYWKVLANGCIGYVPTTALSVPEAIGFVSIEIPEPTTYAPMDTQVEFGVPGCALYRTEPVTWYDSTAGRFLNPGENFLPNHRYQLSVWVAAGSGKRFALKNGNPDVTGSVNGITAKVNTAYEQDPEEVIEITRDFDHVHDLKKIAQKNPSCTVDGRRVYYHCDCGADFEDAYGKIRVYDLATLTIPAPGHWASSWMSDGANHYRFCQRRECGAVIEGSRSAHTGGTANCRSGAVCTVCGLEYGPKGGHIWSGDFTHIEAAGHARTCLFFCGEHSVLQPHRPGAPATATTPQTCLDCGYILQPAVSHSHALTRVPAQDPTCTQPGHGEYYRCSGCETLFRDAAGKETVGLDALAIAPLGHSPADAWAYDADFHWRVCERCGAALEETKMAHDLGEDGRCRTCPYDAGKPEATNETPLPPEALQPAQTQDTLQPEATPAPGADEPAALDPAAVLEPSQTAAPAETPDAPTPSAPPKEILSERKSGVSAGLIVGIVAASLLLAGTVVAGVVLFHRRR